jgi:hypothetical protein
MAETIIEGINFNCNDAIYRAAKINANGGKNIRIVNKNSQSALRLSTPVMLTWGASDYVEAGASQGNGKYEMALQFPTPEYNNQDAELFLENIKRFEAKIREDALKNSKEWFGKQHKSSDIIDELFTPMLKYPKIKGTSEPDHYKAPTIKLKVPCYNGDWKVEIYDEECNKLFPSKDTPVTPLDYLKKGTNVACIIQCAGIWFTNGKFTITWQLVQALVQKPRESIVGKCFIKINSKEKEALKQKVITEESFEADEEVVPQKVQQSSTSIDVVDSDEEDDETPPAKEAAVQPAKEVVEEEVAEEEVVTPVLQVKKKVVKKKNSNT